MVTEDDKRLFRNGKRPAPLDERIVWGIRAPRELKLVYKVIAASLRVPVSVLVGHVLTEWLAENYETLLEDKRDRREFAGYLAGEYLRKRKRK